MRRSAKEEKSALYRTNSSHNHARSVWRIHFQQKKKRGEGMRGEKNKKELAKLYTHSI